jgi:hypothetical protein
MRSIGYGVFIFHENFDRRIALGMVFLVAGAATPGWSGTPLVAARIFPSWTTRRRFTIPASYIRRPITLLPHAMAPVSAE